MFTFLIDTCVWLDLAKDHHQAPALLSAMEQMIEEGILSLIVPRIVLEEFRRNRARIEKDTARSLTSHFRQVKDAVGKVGGPNTKVRKVLQHLDDVNHKATLIGGAAAGTLNRIDKLLSAGALVEPTDAVKLRAAQRAIDKKAPFHGGRNSMADAILIEIYAECARNPAKTGARFAFITHNKNDFSVASGNQKLPHADLASLFSKIKSLYFINLPEALRRVEPSLVSDAMLEHSWSEESRGLAEILRAEDLLFHQVWYNRHHNLRHKVSTGAIKVVEKETYPRPRGRGKETIQRDVWQGALRSASRVEKRYGLENLGPWDDFEWGMVNGKLSALRWVLGDEWDMLDT